MQKERKLEKKPYGCARNAMFLRVLNASNLTIALDHVAHEQYGRSTNLFQLFYSNACDKHFEVDSSHCSHRSRLITSQ